MIFDCPGSHKFKHPEPETIKCLHCGQEAEIWTDEAEVACPGCKKIIRRQEGQSCLGWCKYAKECVGEKIYNRFMKNKKGGR